MKTEEIRKEVNKAIEARKKLLDAGSFVYDSDVKAAEHVWEVLFSFF